MFSVGKKRKIRCPDKSVVWVYKDVEDLYPIKQTEKKSKGNIDIKGLEKVSVAVGKEYAEAIKGVLFKISERNASLILLLRGAYTIFEADPCGQKVAHAERTSQILRDQAKISEIEIRLQAILALTKVESFNPKELIYAFAGLAGQLGDVAPVEAAILELRRTHLESNRWIGEGNG